MNEEVYLCRSPWSWTSRINQHHAHWVHLKTARARGHITTLERRQRMRAVEAMIFGRLRR